MGSIVVPKRVLFDTNHWIELARLRRGQPARLPEVRSAAYRELDLKLRRGDWIPVTTLEQAFEWRCNGNADGALELARVLDSAVDVLDVAPQPATFLIEFLQECRRIEPSLPVEPPPIIQRLTAPNRAMALFRQLYQGSTPVPDAWRRTRLEYQVESMTHRVATTIQALEAEDQVNPDWLEGMQAAFSSTKSQGRGERGFSRATRMEYLDRNLGIRSIVEHLSPECVDRILRDVELTRCPAFDLLSQVMWSFIRDRHEVVENDLGDFSLVHVIPYVDFSLIEKAMWGRIQSSTFDRKTAVFKAPEDLLAALDRD